MSPNGGVRGFLKAAWNHEVGRFARNVVIDVSKGAVILLSLDVMFWILKQIQSSGYPADRVAYFEKVHFCSSLAAFGLLACAFVFKLATGLYGSRK